MKKRGLGRIEILGLPCPHDAPTKGNAFSLLIKDGKHVAIVEAIGKASTTVDGNIRIDHLARRKTLGAQMVDECATARSKTESIALTHIRTQTAARKILASATVLAAHEHRMVKVARRLAHFDKTRALRTTTRKGRFFLKFDARALRKIANGLGKRNVLALHDVGKAVSALTAAKAVPYLRRRDDVKRGGFLAMEGATAPKFMAARTKLHGLLNERNQIGRCANAIFIFITDHARRSYLPSP